MSSMNMQDELKKAYLVKLINMVDSIGWLLAEGQHTDAMKVLASLLAQIYVDKENAELLLLQQNMVQNYETYICKIQPGEPHKMFHIVSQYMNETYFKELIWAKPRFTETKKLRFGEQ